MNIKLHQVHIQNYRSIKELNIQFNDYSVLFGMNDCGKSNILHALNLAFGNGNLEKSDVFVSPERPYDTKTEIYIDLLFVPCEDGNREASFNDVWGLHLGTHVMSDTDDNDFFAYRTEFIFDDDREEYIRDRKVIIEWDGSEIKVGNSIKYKTLQAFEFILLDAQRDLAADIRNRTSLWNKQISKVKLSKESKDNIEQSLIELGSKILDESPFLKQVSQDLSIITHDHQSTIEISPITRSVDELYKGLDIYITQQDASSIPISHLGLGTRSRGVFSALKTIINTRLEQMQESAYYCLLAFEEPEAHIHPHSHKGLVEDFKTIKAQRIITTHSPYLLSTSKLSDLYYLALKKAETCCSPISKLELSKDEMRQITRFVLNTRGDLLFSKVAILAEGETEEQALSIFFREFFHCEPFELGISIIGVGGKNYFPFLKILDCLDVKWFIFSDGEAAAIKDLKICVKKLYDLGKNIELKDFPQIIVLNDSSDFETYLLKNNYENEIIKAIDEFETEEDNDDSYVDYYIQKHHNEPMSPRSTGEKCESCGQSLKVRPPRDYLSEGGLFRALSDCMKSGKAKYAGIISETICHECNPDRKFPPAIKQLLTLVKYYLEE